MGVEKRERQSRIRVFDSRTWMGRPTTRTFIYCHLYICNKPKSKRRRKRERKEGSLFEINSWEGEFLDLLSNRPRKCHPSLLYHRRVSPARIAKALPPHTYPTGKKKENRNVPLGPHLLVDVLLYERCEQHQGLDQLRCQSNRIGSMLAMAFSAALNSMVRGDGVTHHGSAILRSHSTLSLGDFSLPIFPINGKSIKFCNHTMRLMLALQFSELSFGISAVRRQHQSTMAGYARWWNYSADYTSKYPFTACVDVVLCLAADCILKEYNPPCSYSVPGSSSGLNQYTIPVAC